MDLAIWERKVLFLLLYNEGEICIITQFFSDHLCAVQRGGNSNRQAHLQLFRGLATIACSLCEHSGKHDRLSGICVLFLKWSRNNFRLFSC